MKEYYNGIYKDSAEYRKDPKDSIYFEVWKAIAGMLSKTERIYELGCGSGQLGQYLIENGYNYAWGCDYSEEAVKIARTRSDRFKVADIFNIDIPKGTVICTEVLEHIENDLELIGRLKKGTRFIFSVPDFMVKSHVRCFKSEDEIRQRYPGTKEVKKFRVANNKHIFLSEL